MLNVYKEPMKNPTISAVSNTQEHVMEVHATNIHTLSTTMCHTEQKGDNTYKKLAS